MSRTPPRDGGIRKASAVTTTADRFNLFQTMRTVSDMTQEDLAERADVPVDLLDGLERGDVPAKTPPAVCPTCGHVEQEWTPDAKRVVDAWLATARERG
jgi:hypothetical protein